MPDDFDRATALTERERLDSIARARAQVSFRPGAKYCLRCGERNDRAEQGYGVCSDCVEG